MDAFWETPSGKGILQDKPAKLQVLSFAGLDGSAAGVGLALVWVLIPATTQVAGIGGLQSQPERGSKYQCCKLVGASTETLGPGLRGPSDGCQRAPRNPQVRHRAAHQIPDLLIRRARAMTQASNRLEGNKARRLRHLGSARNLKRLVVLTKLLPTSKIALTVLRHFLSSLSCQ